MDRYSEFLQVQELRTKGGVLVGLLAVRERRATVAKPGRTLGVVYDERYPVGSAAEFHVSYEYIMRFDPQRGQPMLPAGDHYHEVKTEWFTSVVGRFDVGLEDRVSREQVWVELDSHMCDPDGTPANVDRYVYVPPGVAHVVIPRTPNSALLVVATSPNSDGDEFPHKLQVPTQMPHVAVVL